MGLSSRFMAIGGFDCGRVDGALVRRAWGRGREGGGARFVLVGGFGCGQGEWSVGAGLVAEGEGALIETSKVPAPMAAADRTGKTGLGAGTPGRRRDAGQGSWWSAASILGRADGP